VAPPRTPLGELTALPRSLTWFKGDPTSKGRGGEVRGEDGREGDRKIGEGQEGGGDAP